MKPCLSEATTLPSTFAEDVVAFAEAGLGFMEVWLTKLEDHLQTHDISQTKRLLDDKGMALAAASYQGGLLLAQGEQRKAHFEHFRKRLELCQQLRIPVLLVAADFADKVTGQELERSLVSLKQAAQWAAAFDVRLALEFRARASVCASLDTALWLVEECGESNVGVNLDVFHFYTGPSKFEDLELLRPENLAFVQVADLAGVPRELASDADRILPGDGDFRLGPIFERLRQIGYKGNVSVELMNPTLWKTNTREVAELARMALERLLGGVGA